MEKSRHNLMKTFMPSELEIDERLARTGKTRNDDEDKVVDSPSHPSMVERTCVGELQGVLLVSLQPFDQQQAGTDRRPFQEITAAAPWMCEHAIQVVDGLRHGFRPENNPTDDSQEESQSHLQRLPSIGEQVPEGYNVLVFRVDAKDVVDGQQGAVI